MHMFAIDRKSQLNELCFPNADLDHLPDVLDRVVEHHKHNGELAKLVIFHAGWRLAREFNHTAYVLDCCIKAIKLVKTLKIIKFLHAFERTIAMNQQVRRSPAHLPMCRPSPFALI